MIDLRPTTVLLDPPSAVGVHAPDLRPDVRPDLRWSAAWCVERADATSCVLSAGADRRIGLDGLSATQVAAIVDWERGAPIGPADETGRLVDRLVEIGAVEPIVPGTTIGLVAAGDERDAPVLAELARHLADQRLVVAAPEASGLPLLVRTGAEWPSPPAGVHLAVDLTLDHTVVIGPLAVPGVTACVACAVGRAAHRWGEIPVPPRPRITGRLAVVAALVAVQVELAVQRRSPLVNATVAWNLEQATTDRQRAYKLPGCAVCDRSPIDGRVELPWVDRSGGAGS